MLVLDMREVGNKLLAIRKRMGMTQVEVAERVIFNKENIGKYDF